MYKLYVINWEHCFVISFLTVTALIVLPLLAYRLIEWLKKRKKQKEEQLYLQQRQQEIAAMSDFRLQINYELLRKTEPRAPMLDKVLLLMIKEINHRKL